MAPALEVRNATKFYGESKSQSADDWVRALDDVSLRVERGELVALVGKSGCGKTTLLNLCGGLDRPQSGTVTVDGQQTGGLDDDCLTRLRRDKVGFIFQSFQLLPTLTVLENVAVPLLLARRRDTTLIARQRLRAVEMEGLEGRYIHQLSGGQQQRVAIARALVLDPVVLLADEPTGNLDSSTGEVVMEVLSRTAREAGAAVLIATHSVESAAYASRIVHMQDGRITSVITTPEARLLGV